MPLDLPLLQCTACLCRLHLLKQHVECQLVCHCIGHPTVRLQKGRRMRQALGGSGGSCSRQARACASAALARASAASGSTQTNGACLIPPWWCAQGRAARRATPPAQRAKRAGCAPQTLLCCRPCTGGVLGRACSAAGSAQCKCPLALASTARPPGPPPPTRRTGGSPPLTVPSCSPGCGRSAAAGGRAPTAPPLLQTGSLWR